VDDRPNDAVTLLIDHQSGLFQLVKDIDLSILRAHVTALAKVAHLARIPGSVAKVLFREFLSL